MVRMLVTINISKCLNTWSQMSKSLEPEMNKIGRKMIWAGANEDETVVYVVAGMQDPSQIKTFCERPNIKAICEAGGADVARTTVISPIGEYSVF